MRTGLSANRVDARGDGTHVQSSLTRHSHALMHMAALEQEEQGTVTFTGSVQGTHRNGVTVRALRGLIVLDIPLSATPCPPRCPCQRAPNVSKTSGRKQLFRAAVSRERYHSGRQYISPHICCLAASGGCSDQACTAVDVAPAKPRQAALRLLPLPAEPTAFT